MLRADGDVGPQTYRRLFTGKSSNLPRTARDTSGRFFFPKKISMVSDFCLTVSQHRYVCVMLAHYTPPR